MKHIFFTGEVGVGKSRLIRRLLEGTGERVCGFCSKKEPRAADGIERIYIHRPGADRYYAEANCVGQSEPGKTAKRSFPEVFDALGVELLSDMPAGSLVVMDELGYLESSAPMFCKKVLEILDGDYRVFGVVKKKEAPFLDTVRAREDVRLFEITVENRDRVYELVKELLKGEQFI